MRMSAALFLVLVSVLPALPQQVQHFGYPVDTEASMTECVSCHNGRRGRDVSRCTTDRMCAIYGKHIVDVPYPPAGREKDYAPVEELSVYGIQLINDRIACCSCHSMTSGKEHLLILESRGDRLCRACHRM